MPALSYRSRKLRKALLTCEGDGRLEAFGPVAENLDLRRDRIDRGEFGRDMRRALAGGHQAGQQGIGHRIERIMVQADGGIELEIAFNEADFVLDEERPPG